MPFHKPIVEASLEALSLFARRADRKAKRKIRPNGAPNRPQIAPKISVFLWKVLQILGFLRFLLFPLVVLSETSFWSHFGFIFGSKIVKNRFRTGLGKMMIFWLLFFSRFWRFWGPLGGPRAPLGSTIFASFSYFLGSRRQICSCTPLPGPVWMIFDDLGCFQVCFLMFF